MLSRTDVAKTQVNMAIVVKNQGKFDRALELYEKALKTRGHDTWQHGIRAQLFGAERASDNEKQPSTQDLSGALIIPVQNWRQEIWKGLLEEAHSILRACIRSIGPAAAVYMTVYGLITARVFVL